MRPLSFFLAALFLFFAVPPATNSKAYATQSSEAITPVLMQVENPPIPFHGSDGKTHLVYELNLQNFSSGNVAVERIDILGDGSPIATLDSAQIATRLQPYGKRESAPSLLPGTGALLFIHVILLDAQAVPHLLLHRVKLHADAAPPGLQDLTETDAEVSVDFQPVAVIGPPLRGAGYVSADSCCDATRHTRAALPVNGRIWLAQRYAVDWEQLDDQSRIYHGPQDKDESYTIYGKEVFAVADAKVVFVTDKYRSQTPGQYPTNISIDEADGNSVVLDLGHSRYALYAHLQQGKIRVHAGDTVKRGEVIGLVGNSGNSVAPHLHFHVMSTPTPLASNGLPYEIDNFQVTGATPGTHAFDEAEEKGTPLAVTPFSPPRLAKNALPLDQLIISFEP
jgi:Peptidase family M23